MQRTWGEGGLIQNSAGSKPLTGQFSKVPVFKKNRTFTTQATNMPQHLCVPSTRPATKVQGPRLWAMPAHRTVNNHHYAWSHEAVGRLWEGLCGATLVGGIGPASWRSRQRSGCVQGGGGMRWGGRLILNGSTGERIWAADQGPQRTCQP